MSHNKDELYVEDYYYLLKGRGGHIKVTCPFCQERRSNKRDKSLSIDANNLLYKCHYCGASGKLKSKMNDIIVKDERYFKPKRKEYVRPTKKIDATSSKYAESFLEYFKGRGISEETLIKANVTQEIEYFPQLGKKSGCIAFNYMMNGELINAKYRTRNKDFKLIAQAELLPYNIDSIDPRAYDDNEPKTAILTEGECFDCSAEILTPLGWKKIKDIEDGDMVAQYENGIITFVKPLSKIVKPYNGKMCEYSNKRNNYYSFTTPKHNLVCVKKNGTFYKVKADEINSQVSIIRSGIIDNEGIDMSDDELRLFVAISADFTLRKEGDLYGAFKKERKVTRLCEILDRLGIRYSNNIDSRGYHSFFIRRGHGITCSKDFPMEWIGKLSYRQMQLILDEILLWDGNFVNGRTMTEYSSNRYNNVLFIQTLCHLTNKRSVICKRDNEHGSWYKVTIIQKQTSSINSKLRTMVDYNDNVYCVTVPSGAIVVRQNELITISGNCDTLSYLECGYKHVISCPNGANANLGWLDDYIDSHFEYLEYIYISVDNDRKGLEFREELIRRFGSDKCRIVDYPAPCKDINEVLCQYGKNEVKKCIDNFTEIRPDGIEELTDVETNLDYLYNHGFQKGITAGIDKLDDILSFKTGMLAIVTGIPSHGKTFALNYILSKINILHDWKMAFFSPEFYPVYEHIAQMAETLGGKRFSKENYTLAEYEQMKKYICNNFFWIDPDDTDITSVLERAKYLIKKKGIKVLVIDPFNALTDKERKTQKQDEYISEFLQKLRWFARKYGIIVFLVAHPTKQQKLENGLYPVVDLYAVKGASEIFDKADIGLTIWRNEQDNYAEIHVTKMKFRHLGEKGFATFRFNINNGRFVTIEDARSLKERGLDMRSMPITWDNSNYILDKIRNQENQISIGLNEDKVEHKTDFMAYSQPQEEDYTDDFFTENNEVPF